MVSSEPETGAAGTGQGQTGTDMTDPENYGSLSIEDPDGDVTDDESPDEVLDPDHPLPSP